MSTVLDRFMLKDEIVVITGAVGLLGVKHAEAVAEAGAVPVLLDVKQDALQEVSARLTDNYGREVLGFKCDITKADQVKEVCDSLLKRYKRIDGLINNAANNPKLRDKPGSYSRLEEFPLEMWEADIAVGLTGALICSRIFGAEMAKQNKGVILNIASDLGLIAPDQRIYRKEGLTADEQPVKPVTYSVVKHGLIGLSRYLATYWADKNVRSNVLCPGGVANSQKPEFVEKLTNLIPLGRMARQDEYMGAVVFLLSQASSYMNGAVVAADGGRTVW